MGQVLNFDILCRIKNQVVQHLCCIFKINSSFYLSSININNSEEYGLTFTDEINIINALKDNLCSLFNNDFTVYDKDFVMSLSIFSIHKLYLLKLRYNYYSYSGHNDKANDIYEKILSLDNDKNMLEEKVKEIIHI